MALASPLKTQVASLRAASNRHADSPRTAEALAHAEVVSDSFARIVESIRTAGGIDRVRSPLRQLGEALEGGVNVSFDLADKVDSLEAKVGTLTTQNAAVVSGMERLMQVIADRDDARDAREATYAANLAKLVSDRDAAEAARDAKHSAEVASRDAMHSAEVAVRDAKVDSLAATVGRLEQDRQRLLLRAAATRIDEIIVEDALSIPKADMRSAKLFSAEHVKMLIKRFGGGFRDVPPFVDDAFIARATAELPAMFQRKKDILSLPGVSSGMATVVATGGLTAHNDPADNLLDWEHLLDTAGVLYEGCPEKGSVLAMVRAYVDTRLHARMEPVLATQPRGF